MNYLELYKPAYTTKRLCYRLQWSGYTLELYRYVYITKRLSYRLQRRRFMNYLERYKSAYTTKRLWYRLQWSGYTLELIDMSTSLKGFRIASKKEIYELFRAL